MVTCVFCRKGITCPMHNREVLFKSTDIARKEEFDSASPPTVFIGSKLKYPEVNIGVMSPPSRTEENWLFDAQRYWARNDYNIDQILNLRQSLINSRTKTRVKEIKGVVEKLQEVGMTSKPVDIEVKLQHKIKGRLNFNQITLPQGLYGTIKNLKFGGNVKIPRKVDKVNSDVDLKAVGAMEYLWKSGFDEQQICQVLSVGSVGLKKNRRLVPTRFSITATDDTIGKQLMKEIRDYKLINDCELRIGSYLGNYYFMLLFPGVFSYELFESYVSGEWKGAVTTDYESSFGRTKYVSETAGGYYAARLPVLEYLHGIKKQASVLALRFITNEYYAHLGVFVCREAARKTMKGERIVFDSKERMIDAVKKIVFKRFGIDVSSVLKRSKLLDDVLQQKRLFEFS